MLLAVLARLGREVEEPEGDPAPDHPVAVVGARRLLLGGVGDLLAAAVGLEPGRPGQCRVIGGDDAAESRLSDAHRSVLPVRAKSRINCFTCTNGTAAANAGMTHRSPRSSFSARIRAMAR